MECVYSEDVASFARSQGYYSGSDADFSIADTYNDMQIVAKMKEIVPEYKSNNSVFQTLDQ